MNRINRSIKCAGIVYGAVAFMLWGFMPLYWNLLKEVPSDELLAHRIVWALVFMAIFLAATKKVRALKSSFSNRKTILLVFLGALFNCINWLVYIWAINHSHVIEASMGYFINPLVAILLGVVVLKEKLHALQIMALALAAIGVLISIFAYGTVPWISLILAVSFALYGLIKKIVPLESSVSLTIETAMMAPFALGYILLKQFSGTGSLGKISLPNTLLLLCSGIATAIPLLLFAKSAKRVNLSVIGLLQYISPTISFLLGIFFFHEQFVGTNLVSYSFVWAAIILFSLSNLQQFKLIGKERGKWNIKNQM